jgi:NAD(P)H-dependent FMN reductase
MNEPFLPVILGTARPGRQSRAVAEAVLDAIKQRDATTELVDVADYELTATGAEGTGVPLDRYRSLVAAADGFVIVAPEYNHGYPGELKLLLDSEFAGYRRKPVGFVGVASGRIGGARVIEQLQQVTTALRMVPVLPSVNVTNVNEAMNERGEFDAGTLGTALDEMLDEVQWYARNLSMHGH